MTNLFTYGTLMYQDVMYDLSSEKYPFKKATLKGYQRQRLVHRAYPGLIIAPGQSVEGVVYLGINEKDLKRLHIYESEYTPIEVELLTEDNEYIDALAYLYNKPEKTTKEVWDPKEYEKSYR